MRYFIRTFGCQQNLADSERIAAYYESKGYKKAEKIENADLVVINSCGVRAQAENRIYGLVRNLNKNKKPSLKIIVTGCVIGAAKNSHQKEDLIKLKKRLPGVDLLLTEEIILPRTIPSFPRKGRMVRGLPQNVIRTDKKHAWVSISSGCNNFCTFCIVPYARGKEKSRPFQEIVNEIKCLVEKGYKEITLLGQNVNSYGADLIKNKNRYVLPNEKVVKPILVKSLGRIRIPTLFPYLLGSICKINGIKKVNFISSNPWDFSDKLINVIAQNKKISRTVHLPVQSGDDKILKKMNRFYKAQDYLNLIRKIRKKVPEVKFTTDIIVGFPGETKKAFENTVKLAKKVKFEKAYIACYSLRPYTFAAKNLKDDVPHKEKDKRFRILDKIINGR